MAKIRTQSLNAYVKEVLEKYNAETTVKDVPITRHQFSNVVTLVSPKKSKSREAIRVARAINELDLHQVRITTQQRGGDKEITQLSNIVKGIKQKRPHTLIEANIPLLKSRKNSLRKIIQSNPDIISHDLITIKRLTPLIRGKQYSYQSSISLLADIKYLSPNTLTKSCLLIGAGETWGEVWGAIRHLRKRGLDILTIQQYIQNSKNHPKTEIHDNERFEFYERIAYQMGFNHVISEPLIGRD